MVYNLVDRSFILSGKQFHDDNGRIIIRILLNNKYPIEFIKVNMRNRLNEIIYVDKNHDGKIFSKKIF